MAARDLLAGSEARAVSARAALAPAPPGASDGIQLPLGSVLMECRPEDLYDAVVKKASRHRFDVGARFFGSINSKLLASSCEDIEKRFVLAEWEVQGPEKWLRRTCTMCGVVSYDPDKAHLQGQTHMKNLQFNVAMDTLLGPSLAPRVNGQGWKPGVDGVVTDTGISSYWGAQTHLFAMTLRDKTRTGGFNVRVTKKRHVFVPASSLQCMISALVSYQAGQGVYNTSNKVLFWHQLPKKVKIPETHSWWPVSIMSFKPEEAARLVVQDWWGPSPSDGEDDAEDNVMEVEDEDGSMEVAVEAAVGSDAATGATTASTTLAIATCGRQGEDEIPAAWPIRISRPSRL